MSEMGFIRRARKMLDASRPIRLEHDMLLAALAAQQAASPTARAQARRAAAPAPGGGEDALTELLLAGPDWRDAAVAQGGCFRRTGAGATERQSPSPGNLPSHFRLPSMVRR